MRGVLLALGVVAATGAQAQERDPLPDFATCFAQAIAHFEMEFARTGVADAVEDFEIVTRERVEFCGTLAIVSCDRGEAPQACQRDLAAEELALRDRVLASLPAPETLDGDGIWTQGLYPTLWDVAHGVSAGDDCAGVDDPVASWCVTHEARLKLGEAVALWQVARLLGAVGPAAELGWVDEAMPFAPVPRPEQEITP